MDKVGHWNVVEIEKDFRLSGKGIVIQCDICKFIHTILCGSQMYVYCPQCGQQMIVNVEDMKTLPDYTNLVTD